MKGRRESPKTSHTFTSAIPFLPVPESKYIASFINVEVSFTRGVYKAPEFNHVYASSIFSNFLNLAFLPLVNC